MSVSSRSYTDDDLPRLQAALARWIRAAGACGYCHPGELPHRIYAELRGARPVGELVRIWEDASSIIGMAIHLRFGRAFDLFTSPVYRGTDAELGMLESAWETTLRQVREAEREEAPVLTDVYGCDHTRIELLARLGFEEYRRWDHINERGLAGSIPPSRMPDAFALRSATMADYEQLAAVRNSAFADDWTPELYRDEVMRKPGYEPEREIVVVAPDGRIAAFTVIWLDEVNGVGHFEPVGTHRDFQRRGLARALLLHGLQEMKRRGMRTATVAHDASNLAARELYRGLGFRKKYETLGYRRP